MPKHTFNKWFDVGRVWGGRIIEVRVKHHQLSFDFRRNWLADMVRGCPNAPHQARAVASRPECGCSTIGGKP